MKKKKRVDMTIIISREERKMRKIEKAIRKQEAKGRQLKPIDEIEGDRSFIKTLELVPTFSVAHCTISISLYVYMYIYIYIYSCDFATVYSCSVLPK